MTDDPTEDRAEYDESVKLDDKSVNLALCPKCRVPLRFCDPLGFPVGCNWWCPGCEDYFDDRELT